MTILRRVLAGIALVAIVGGLTACGVEPQGGSIIVTSTPKKGIISDFPTTKPATTIPTTTAPTTTQTTTTTPPPTVVTTVIIVQPPPATTTQSPIKTTTAAPPPATRPAPQMVTVSSALRPCGGTRVVKNQALPPVNDTVISLNTSGVHFQFLKGRTTPGIPINGAIVQTTNPATDAFRGYELPLNATMIGTAPNQTLDIVISAPEEIRSVTFCDS